LTICQGKEHVILNSDVCKLPLYCSSDSVYLLSLVLERCLQVPCVCFTNELQVSCASAPALLLICYKLKTQKMVLQVLWEENASLLPRETEIKSNVKKNRGS
jgi:hypothetical protein